MWIAKGINVTRIYTGDSSYANDSANLQTLAGVGFDLPIQKFIIDSGVSVEEIRIPFDSNHGYVELENNGIITGRTGVVGEYPVNNPSGYTLRVTGRGHIGSRKEQRFTFVTGSQAQLRFLGGQGGASAPDFFHIPKYGRAFGCHLERVPAGTGTPVTVTASNFITSNTNTVPNASTIAPTINSNGRLYTHQLFANSGATGTSSSVFTVDKEGTYEFYIAYHITGANATGVFKLYKSGALQNTYNLFTTSGVWKSETHSIYLFVGDSIRIESTFPSSGLSASYVYVGADNFNTSTLTPLNASNNFLMTYTYNECDYVNLGGGSFNGNSTGVFTNWVDANGNILGGGSQQVQFALGGRRRDYRDVTIGTCVMDDGNRYWWVCSNAKRHWGMHMNFSTAASGYVLYVMPRWYNTTLTKANANFSSVATGQTDNNPFSGPVDYTKFTGIIEGV